MIGPAKLHVKDYFLNSKAAPGLANGAVGCPQALPSVRIDDDACGKKVPGRVCSSCAVSCASLPLLRPPQSRPRFRPRSHPRPRSHFRYCIRFRVLN